MGFKKEFVWGAATAAYQIEGGAYQDGKGLSVWDMVCQTAGFVKNGDHGDIACDHYNRMEEDVKLMKEMGLLAYRFSISWPRILPNGTGEINEKGIAFYDRLIDTLLRNQIEPYITIFHWDYPYELYKKGGWLNPESPDWFAYYTRIIVERYSDRVKYWITQNEPQCYIDRGHDKGVQAPGLRLGLKDLLLASHNSLLAHGKAVQVIRAYAKQPVHIGYAPVGITYAPASGSEADIEAARQVMFSVKEKDLWNNSWWMDPVFLGAYPKDGMKLFESVLPYIGQNDMKLISQPIDFLGTNIYNARLITIGSEGKTAEQARKPGFARTAYNWSVSPEALYWGPKFFYERYKTPFLITENGMSNTDWVHLDGKVHDPQRIDFLARYLHEYQRAVDDGVDALGYFCWSFMDNFEWASGYNERFGLVYVNFETQERIMKDSGHWYRQVIETNGKDL